MDSTRPSIPGVGARRHGPTGLSEADVVRVRELRASGIRSGSLAAQYGVSASLVSQICSGRAWKSAGGPITIPLAPRIRGEADVISIRERRAAGEQIAAIAKEYGVSRGAIAGICAGRSHAECSGPLIKRERYSSISERFQSMVDRESGPVHPVAGKCWLFTGLRLPKGYGRFFLNEGGKWKSKLAHRVALQLSGADVPDDAVVMHRCDHPPCVNPDHLRIGTTADNVADKMAKGRGVVGSAHGGSVLDELKVVEIRRRREAGEPIEEVARRYGVSIANISRIVNRKTWRHVAPVASPSPAVSP